MEPDGKSGFNEMTGTVPMGRNVDGLETTPSTGAEKTDGAWGTECFGSAKGFGGLSLGSDTEG